jgi:methylase of polypeptide subunit release factors
MKIIEIKDKKLIILNQVYEPAEDSYLFLDHLERTNSHLDIGCGCGIVGVFSKSKYLDCIDINPYALINTKINLLLNKKENFNVFYSNLFSEVYKMYDLITFNFPYLSYGVGDIYEHLSYSYLDRSEALYDRFVKTAKYHLSENGIILFTISSELKIIFGRFKKYIIDKFSFDGETVGLVKLSKDELYRYF